MKRIFLAIAILLSLAVSADSQQSFTLFYVGTAVDVSGDESGFSNEAPATVSAAHAVVDLSWTASTTPNVSYNLYRSRVSGGPYVKINATLISGTTYTDTITFPASQTNLKTVVP